MKSKLNALKIVGLVFVLVGIVFGSIGAGFIFHGFKVKQNYEMTEATIMDFEFKHNKTEPESTVFKYKVDGKTYEEKSYVYSSSWRKGDIVKIYYNPEAPQKIETKMALVVFSATFGGIGILFLGLGITMFIINFCKNKNKKNLIENGRRIYGTVAGFTQNYHVCCNNRHPFIIDVKYTDGYSKEHHFNSENIWSYLDDSIIGKTVTIYYLNDNFNKYYVDTDVLFKDQTVIYH